jgi:hypothetical protein
MLTDAMIESYDQRLAAEYDRTISEYDHYVDWCDEAGLDYEEASSAELYEREMEQQAEDYAVERAERAAEDRALDNYYD